VKDPLYKIGKW